MLYAIYQESDYFLLEELQNVIKDAIISYPFLVSDNVGLKTEIIQQYRENLDKIFEAEENRSQVVINLISENPILYTGKIISFYSHWCTVCFIGQYICDTGVKLLVHKCALKRIK